MQQGRRQGGLSSGGPLIGAHICTWNHLLRPHHHLDRLTMAEAWSSEIPDWRRRTPLWVLTEDQHEEGEYYRAEAA